MPNMLDIFMDEVGGGFSCPRLQADRNYTPMAPPMAIIGGEGYRGFRNRCALNDIKKRVVIPTERTPGANGGIW